MNNKIDTRKIMAKAIVAAKWTRDHATVIGDKAITAVGSAANEIAAKAKVYLHCETPPEEFADMVMTEEDARAMACKKIQYDDNYRGQHELDYVNLVGGPMKYCLLMKRYSQIPQLHRDIMYRYMLENNKLSFDVRRLTMAERWKYIGNSDSGIGHGGFINIGERYYYKADKTHCEYYEVTEEFFANDEMKYPIKKTEVGMSYKMLIEEIVKMAEPRKHCRSICDMADILKNAGYIQTKLHDKATPDGWFDLYVYGELTEKAINLLTWFGVAIPKQPQFEPNTEEKTETSSTVDAETSCDEAYDETFDCEQYMTYENEES